MKVKLAVLVAAMAGTGIGFAAPAYAGCETQPFARYCDGPGSPRRHMGPLPSGIWPDLSVHSNDAAVQSR